MNAADNQGAGVNQGARLGVGSQLASQNGLNAGDYIDAAQFNNFDIAQSRNAGDQVRK